MVKIVKKGVAFLLIASLNMNILNLSTFAEKDEFDKCRESNGMVNDNLNCYFEEAKKQIKSGKRHITIQNERNLPNYRLELFRYTDLDEIIPSLPFEKEPDKFIENKYGKTFNLIKKISTGVGLIVGAIIGMLYAKILSHMANKRNKSIACESDKSIDASNKELDDINKKPNKRDKRVYLILSVLSSGIFAFLGKHIAKVKISKLKAQEFKKLLIEKKEVLAAMESIKTFIENGIWIHSNCVCIQTYESAKDDDTTVYFWNVDNHRNDDALNSLYSEDEKKHFSKSFEKLKQDLEEILKSNDYKK